MVDHRFTKAQRLLRPDDFRRVFDRKCSASDGQLIVYGRENHAEHARLGLVVSRKVGNAVVRNRWKRLVREAFRLAGSDLPSQLDLVVLPRRGVEPDASAIRSGLPRLAQRVAQKLVRPPRRDSRPR